LKTTIQLSKGAHNEKEITFYNVKVKHGYAEKKIEFKEFLRA
jgi:hypothetical protein